MPAAEPQSHNEAQDLLLLQDYVHKLTNTLRTLEDTLAVLQQAELLAGVINEQDCRDIRTACSCIRSLRIRVEARANVTEREVISRQLQLIRSPLAQGRIGSNPVGLGNLILTQGANIHLG